MGSAMSTAPRVGVQVGHAEPSPEPSADLLRVTRLNVRFPQRGGAVQAVDGLSYSLDQGKTLAIIGESGSGKTVSARALMGLLPPTAEVSGSVVFRGMELVGRSEAAMQSVRGSEIAMVFQNPDRSMNPTMRIGTQIIEAARRHLDLGRAQARALAIDLLRRVQMPDPERRAYEYPHQLSGGMLQRVMIATAIACQPKLLIADEATSALDVTTQMQVMDLLMELQQEFGMALILISHDLGLAASYADNVLVVYAGRPAEGAPTEELFHNVRMHYTRALLEAVPRIDGPIDHSWTTTEGQPPNLSIEAVGCRFAPRCSAAAPDCVQAAPPFAEHEPDHRFACWHPLEKAHD